MRRRREARVLRGRGVVREPQSRGGDSGLGVGAGFMALRGMVEREWMRRILLLLVRVLGVVSKLLGWCLVCFLVPMGLYGIKIEHSGLYSERVPVP